MVNCGKIFLDLKLIYQNQNTLNSLIGTYECKADAKGRLMLPSALKKQLSQAENIMSKAQEQLVVLEDKLADADLYLHENKEKLKSLLDEQAKQKQILEDTELQWFELSEEIEDAEQAED